MALGRDELPGIEIELDDNFANNAVSYDDEDGFVDDVALLAEMNLENPEQPAGIKRLNLGQRIAGGTSSFLTTFSGLVWGSAIIQDESIEPIPVPGDYAVASVGVIGAKEAMDSLRAMSQRKRPWDYLTMEGGGSFAIGFAKEAGKKIVAAIPAVVFTLGMSIGRNNLYQYAMNDPENNMNLLLALSYFDTPLLRGLLIAVPTLLIYAAGQKFIERNIPGMQPPELPPEEDAESYWYQKLLADGIDVINGMTLAGLGRQIFVTIGPELVLHSSLSLMMGPGAILVLALLRYLAENPQPLANVRDFVGEIDEMLHGKADAAAAAGEQQEGQTEETDKARVAMNIGIKVSIALGVLALAILVNRHASEAISAGYPENRGDNDPSGWTTLERVGYEAALTAGVLFTQRMIENIPVAVTKVREDGPDAMRQLRDGTVSAANKAASGVAAAGRAIGASFAGLFGNSSAAPQATGRLVLRDNADNDLYEGMPDNDDDVVPNDGFTI